MAKKIALAVLGALLVVIVGYVAFAASRPDTYRVERTRVIAASVERIQPEMVDLRRWVEWNPWDAMDPDMEKTFSDPSSGVGAFYTWRGDENVGSGRLEITEVAPGRVRYHLAFVEPFESESDVIMTMTPEGTGTRVTWSMEGHQGFADKLFTALMDMDGMIGADFERGLANLERRVIGG